MADIQELLARKAEIDGQLDQTHADALDELAAAKDEARRYPDDPEAKARKVAAAQAVQDIRQVLRAGRGVTIGGDAVVTEGPVA